MTPALVDSPGIARWRALGTYVELVTAEPDRLTVARERAEHLLAEVDRTCSRFRADSDLSRANARAGRWVSVDPLLVRAVRAALDAAAATEGLVDPCLGQTMAALGYDRDLAAVLRAEGSDPTAEPEAAVLPAPEATHRTEPEAAAVSAPEASWRDVRLDPEGAVFVPVGVALDLGATAKAFAADLVAAEAARAAGCDLVLSLGGDVAVGLVDPVATARAVEAGTARRWSVEVREHPVTTAPQGDPLAAAHGRAAAITTQATTAEVSTTETPVAEVAVEFGGVATSSTVRRRWRRGNRGYHHVLDPRTGRPAAEVWRTVSVAAPTCLAANTLTTAALVLGDLAEDWLVTQDVPARLVDVTGRVRCLGGWPEDDPARSETRPEQPENLAASSKNLAEQPENLALTADAWSAGTRRTARGTR